MTANLKDIIAYLSEVVSGLKDSIEGPLDMTAHDAEALILRRVIEIGSGLMSGFLAAQTLRIQDGRTVIDPADPESVELKRNGDRVGLYYSVFGAIEYKRGYYCGAGRGYYPLDARLNIAPSGPSDLLRKMQEELGLHMSYEDAVAFLAKYFPVSASTRALQEAVLTDSIDAKDYYDHAPVPPVKAESTIMAVQADCAGIPMANRCMTGVEPCRDKGSKRHDGRMKMATAISVSTHAPYLRTAEQVVENLFREAGTKPHQSMTDKEGMSFKRVWATLAGKQEALLQAQKYVGQIDTTYITDFIALTDGERGLQSQVDLMFPTHTRILDLRHGISYVYKAADAHFGTAKSKEVDHKAWVSNSILLILQGKADSVIREVEAWSHQIKKKASAYKTLDTVANYFRRNLAAMQYDKYLAAGWPIATGLIEGCCGHVVKGRCDGVGQRWTEAGAEAMLHLSCIEENGDWEAYHDFRMMRRHEIYYRQTPVAPVPTGKSKVYQFHAKQRFAEAV
jgi:hypothetical protein